MAIYKKVTDLVGNTPILELGNYEEKHNLEAKILAKLEFIKVYQNKNSYELYAIFAFIAEREKLSFFPFVSYGISKVNPMAVQYISIEESSKRADEEVYSFKKKHKEKRSNHAFE